MEARINLKCVNHPAKDAAGTCIICNRPYCSACAIEMPDSTFFCYPDVACGNALVNTGPSRMSILGLVLSLVGFTTGITGLAGAIIGFVELGKVSRGESAEESRKYARAAIIAGLISFSLFMLYFLFILVFPLLVVVT